jgi:hypothetical protein
MSQNNVTMDANNNIHQPNSIDIERHRIVSPFFHYIDEIFLQTTKGNPNKATVRLQRISNYLEALSNAQIDNPVREHVLECIQLLQTRQYSPSVLFLLANGLVVNYPHHINGILTQYASVYLA